MTLLPRTTTPTEHLLHHHHHPAHHPDDDPMDQDLPPPTTTTSDHQLLLTSQTGSIALITPMTEESYRRLSALQSQLTNTLEHPCGLNPRAYRSVESDASSGRGMLDGDLLRRWLDLGRQRRLEIAGRVGASEWDVRADLEMICGAGLGFV